MSRAVITMKLKTTHEVIEVETRGEDGIKLYRILNTHPEVARIFVAHHDRYLVGVLKQLRNEWRNKRAERAHHHTHIKEGVDIVPKKPGWLARLILRWKERRRYPKGTIHVALYKKRPPELPEISGESYARKREWP